MNQSASKDVIPRYHQSLDFDALWREFPPAPDYFSGTYRLSSDELRALQEQRFLRQMARAWQVPFYRRRWSAAGLEPGDISGLDDLVKMPPFSVHDMRASVLNEPPWADYIGIDPTAHAPMPLILQTSGGTTGLPRPMIFMPRDREVMNIITGRRLYMQGVRPFDLVQVALSMGLTNGGVLAREGIWKYTGAVPVMTGSGAQTPTRRQIELIRAWKAKFLIGFPAYLRHMGLVARDEIGIDPREPRMKGLIVHLGMDDRPRSRRFGAPTPTIPMAATNAERWPPSAATRAACMFSRTLSCWKSTIPRPCSRSRKASAAWSSSRPCSNTPRR